MLHRPVEPAAKTGLMHCNKNSEAFRYRSTVKLVAEVQFEACYPALQCSGHDPIGVGANGNRHRKTAIHIRARTGDGRKRAMAKGVRFGRKPKLSEFQRQETLKRRAAGEIAKSYAVDVSMISRLH